MSFSAEKEERRAEVLALLVSLGSVTLAARELGVNRNTANSWARKTQLPRWLRFYDYHRHHSAVSGPPISRLNNLPGHRS